MGEGRSEPSTALKEVWTKAQEVREWLTLGDSAAAAVDGDGDSNYDVQQSRLCEEVGRRGRLLLDVNIAVLTGRLAKGRWAKLKSFARRVVAAPDWTRVVQGAKVCVRVCVGVCVCARAR